MTTEKLFFVGTPAQFYAIIVEYEIDTIQAGRTRVSVDGPDSRLPPETPRIQIRIVFSEGKTGMDFYLSALMCPGNRTQITLSADEKSWPSVQEQWKLIVDYITNLGWLIEHETVGQSPVVEYPRAAATLKELETENDLRNVLYDIRHDQGTPGWWKEAAPIFWQYKKTHPKYTYGQFRDLMGYTDEKYVGEMLRLHRNHPKPP